MPVGSLILITSKQMRVYFTLFWWKWKQLFSSIWLNPDLCSEHSYVGLSVSVQKRFTFHWYCETYFKNCPINMKNRKKFCFALFCYGLIDIRQDFLKIVLSLLAYFPWENLLVYNYLLTTLFYQKFLGILPIFSSSSPGLKQWLSPSFE